MIMEFIGAVLINYLNENFNTRFNLSKMFIRINYIKIEIIVGNVKIISMLFSILYCTKLENINAKENGYKVKVLLGYIPN